MKFRCVEEVKGSGVVRRRVSAHQPSWEGLFQLLL